jgi:hypothetical protein
MIAKDKITVQLLNPDNVSLLSRSGINDIVVFDDIGGYLLADNILIIAAYASIANCFAPKTNICIRFPYRLNSSVKAMAFLRSHLRTKPKAAPGLDQ